MEENVVLQISSLVRLPYRKLFTPNRSGDELDPFFRGVEIQRRILGFCYTFILGEDDILYPMD